ncbi:HTH-type transcriptional regulator MalT [Halomonadaceae bacterium LMG 33818]|uniref:helix-turn-helix transcriptional regulator n=1 Tax=Cernens ardua TaxID=3402176 RepID=UPI003EDBCE24
MHKEVVAASMPNPIWVVAGRRHIQLRMEAILCAMGYDIDNDLLIKPSVSEVRESWQEYSIGLVILDVDTDSREALLLIEDFNQNNVSFPVVIITSAIDEDIALKALQLGVVGYLSEERHDIELIMSFRNVFKGGISIDPFALHYLLKKLNEITLQDNDADEQNNLQVMPLTRRESEILTLVSEGLSNRQIAEFLNISKYTIGSHIKHIYKKLIATSRTQAVHIARENGWLPFSSSYPNKKSK